MSIINQNWGKIMKEFMKSQKVTYNLMSFTGFKALLVFSMLLEGPKSFEEIQECLENHPYLNEKVSKDTIRVYINSLKRIGCEINRTRGDDKVSRYFITAHPFELKITEEQQNSIMKIYKNLVKNMDIQDLLYMDNFFEKIGSYIKNEDFVFSLRKISPIKDIDKKLLSDLLDCCEKKQQIVIRYNSPNSGEKNIEIVADKIDISNNKVYLYGFGFEYQEYGLFLVSRIKYISEIKFAKTIIDNKNNIKVVYEITYDNFKPNDNEKILKQDGNFYIVEADTNNSFLLKQRLLSFGPACKIIKPDEFKEEFIQILKDMKAGYYCG